MPRHSGHTRKPSRPARHRAAQRSADRARRKQDTPDPTTRTPDTGTPRPVSSAIDASTIDHST